MSTNNYLNQFEFVNVPKPNLIKELPNGSHIYCLSLKKDVQLPPHTGPGNAYLMVSEGECILTIEGEAVHLKQGDFFDFDASREHDVKTISDFRAIVITTFPFSEVKFT